MNERYSPNRRPVAKRNRAAMTVRMRRVERMRRNSPLSVSGAGYAALEDSTSRVNKTPLASLAIESVLASS
jgi:hypothetical protein